LIFDEGSTLTVWQKSRSFRHQRAASRNAAKLVSELNALGYDAHRRSRRTYAGIVIAIRILEVSVSARSASSSSRSLGCVTV